MRKFFIIAIVAGVGFVAWWIFDSHALYSFRGTSGVPIRESNTIGTVEGAGTVAQNTISRTGKTVLAQSRKAIQGAVANGEAAITSAKTTIANKARNLVSGVFNEAVDVGRTYLGITSPGIASINLYDKSSSALFTLLGFVVPSNRPVSFVVGKELFVENGVQEIDAYMNWQDGTRESKKMYPNDQSNFLTHTFTNSGTYKPLFTFLAGSSTIQYEITIMVKN